MSIGFVNYAMYCVKGLQAVRRQQRTGMRMRLCRLLVSVKQSLCKNITLSSSTETMDFVRWPTLAWYHSAQVNDSRNENGSSMLEGDDCEQMWAVPPQVPALLAQKDGFPSQQWSSLNKWPLTVIHPNKTKISFHSNESCYSESIWIRLFPHSMQQHSLHLIKLLTPFYCEVMNEGHLSLYHLRAVWK